MIKKDEKAVVGEKIEKLNFSFHKNDNFLEEDYKKADCDQDKKISTLIIQKGEVFRARKQEKAVLGGKIEKFNSSFHKNDSYFKENYMKADRDENKEISSINLQKEEVLCGEKSEKAGGKESLKKLQSFFQKNEKEQLLVAYACGGQSLEKKSYLRWMKRKIKFLFPKKRNLKQEN